MVCLVSLIYRLYPSCMLQELYCEMEWRKEEIKLDGYSEIDDWFLITSHILLKICRRDNMLFFFLRGISVYKIFERILVLLLDS